MEMTDDDTVDLLVYLEGMATATNVGGVSRSFASNFINAWGQARHDSTCPDASEEIKKEAEYWLKHTMLVINDGRYSHAAVQVSKIVAAVASVPPPDERATIQASIELNKAMTEAYKRMNKEKDKEDKWKSDDEEDE